MCRLVSVLTLFKTSLKVKEKEKNNPFTQIKQKAHTSPSTQEALTMAEGQAPIDIPTLAAIACVTLFVIYKIFAKRSSSAPPTAKIGIPLIGNYIEFAKNPVRDSSFFFK